MKFIYKLENGLLPKYFTGIFIHRRTDHDHNTRYRNTNTIPVPRTSAAKETIRYYLPNFIKNVPNIIQQKVYTHSLIGFADYSKKYFISLYSTEFEEVGCYVYNT